MIYDFDKFNESNRRKPTYVKKEEQNVEIGKIRDYFQEFEDWGLKVYVYDGVFVVHKFKGLGNIEKEFQDMKSNLEFLPNTSKPRKLNSKYLYRRGYQVSCSGSLYVNSVEIIETIQHIKSRIKRLFNNKVDIVIRNNTSLSRSINLSPETFINIDIVTHEKA